MSITMINNTQKPFVVVNKAIAMDKDLNMRDRGMMLTLMSFPPEWNFSIKGLEKIVPDGRDAISSSLQRLEEKRYLVRVQERDEKGKFADTKIYTKDLCNCKGLLLCKKLYRHEISGNLNTLAGQV